MSPTKTWKNRVTGHLAEGAMPPGPDWLEVVDGEAVDNLGAVTPSGRSSLGWRAGGSRPDPSPPPKPIDFLHHGLGPGDKDLLGRSR